MISRRIAILFLGALMTVVVACDGGGPAAQDDSPSPSATGSPVAAIPSRPSLGDLIQEETGRLEEMGFTADDVIEMSLDGKSQHVAMVIGQTKADPDAPVNFEAWREVLVFSRAQGWEPFGGKALLIYEVRQGKLVRIFDRWQPWFSLDFGTRELGAVDIDANGVPELVVGADFGGASGGGWLEIYVMSNGLIRNVLQSTEPLRGAPGRVEDIDGDGIYELVVGDDTFEFEFNFCHACSPGIALVYKWADGRFVEASAEYAAYYDEQISEVEARLAASPAIPSYAVPGGAEARPDLADSDRASRAIEIFLLHEAKGDAETGWQRYRSVMNSEGFLTEQWKEWIPAINVLMAHAYGFRDFGAEKYLRFPDYPEALRSQISFALNQERAQGNYPFYYEPRSIQLRSSPGVYSIYYSPRLDYFKVAYEGDICTDEATEQIRQALGVKDIGRLAIESRIAAGC